MEPTNRSQHVNYEPEQHKFPEQGVTHHPGTNTVTRHYEECIMKLLCCRGKRLAGRLLHVPQYLVGEAAVGKLASTAMDHQSGRGRHRHPLPFRITDVT